MIRSVLRSASIAASLTALGLALAPAAGAVVRRGTVYGPAPANRALAHRAASGLVRALRVPGDAQRTGHPPHGTRGRLSAVPIVGREARLVDAHSFWRMDKAPGAVLRYVAHHLPPGVERSSRVSGGSSNGVGLLFWQIHPPSGLAMRAVAVSAVALPSGLTAVRLDGTAQWLAPRPRWERVPADVELATAAGHGARPGDGDAAGPESRVTVLESGTARRLAAWINSRPVAQPGEFYSCPFGADQVLGVQFLGAGGGLLARATESLAGGCPTLSLTIGGRTGPALEDQGLQQELVRLHVISSCRADELSAPAPGRTRVDGKPALAFTWRDSSPEICTTPTLPSIALLDAGGRVLVGHDLHRPAGSPTVLFPGTKGSVTAGFQNCPSRPVARRARVRLSPTITWSVPLTRGLPVRPCVYPLTLIPDALG
jgi:hypothetical protein